MVDRRDLMGGSLAAGLAAMMSPAAAEAAAQRDDDGAMVAAAIGELRQAWETQIDRPWRVVGQIRAQQRTWLRASQKFPDFIEVGIDVWEGVYDWHVRYQQPLNVARTPEGRYAMAFQFTTLLLRPDQAPDYISYPYDTESPARRVP